MFSLKILLILIVCLCVSVDGSKILFFFGLSTYSHRISVWPLVEKLAEKGHEITFIQPFKPKRPNPKVKEFFPKQLGFFAEEFEKMDLLTIRIKEGREAIIAMNKDQLPKFGISICENFVSDPETQEWVKTAKFDLIVIDALMNDCGFGFAHIFGAKTIIYGTSSPFGWWYDTFGIPVDASSIDDPMIPYKYPMTWLEKGMTSIFSAFMYLQKQSHFYPALDKIFQKHFNQPNFPSLADLERKTSLIFTNTHFSEEHSRSLPPFVVSVGGMHCEDSTQKLTKELETFINGSGEEGFIYISFGSAAKVSLAPPEFQNIFYTALGKSKARFIWKYEGTRPSQMPANVFTDTWMPQQAILAHPKIKAFLTHGGLLSMQEAVWHGVPLMPIPIFAEQDYNALRVDRTERGIMLDSSTLTIEKLESAIHRVTTDPKYKKNMEKTSRLFRDRPEKPVDTAVWWTEYVLRHDENDLDSALKPLAMKQTWYQRRLLDVWAILFTTISVTLVIVLIVVKKMVNLVCRLLNKKPSGGGNKVKKN